MPFSPEARVYEDAGLPGASALLVPVSLLGMIPFTVAVLTAGGDLVPAFAGAVVLLLVAAGALWVLGAVGDSWS